MADTVLQLINDVQLELGLPVSATIANAVDKQTLRLLAHMNAQGRALVKEYYWSGLLGEPYSFSLVANQELYPVPSDFDRIVGDTQWDFTNHWPMLGPDDPQVARYVRDSSLSNATPRRRLRQQGNFISIWPVPGASGDVMHYDYVRNAWAINGATGLSQSSMGANDSDTCLYNDDLMIKGCKWRFQASLGMGTAIALKGEHDDWLQKCIAADMGGGKIISMLPRDYGNADFVIAGAQPIGILEQDDGSPILIQ